MNSDQMEIEEDFDYGALLRERLQHLDGDSLDRLSSQDVIALLSQITDTSDIDRFFAAVTSSDTEKDDRSSEMPKSLIITNLDIQIFKDENSPERLEFESLFREYDSDVKILYFKSFRRARVDFSSSVAATKARILCHQKTIGQESINCFFADMTSDVDSTKVYLRPPAATKQFLISPPASPPEGWEPVEEGEPVLNIDLQSALANLLPGSAHELHPASEHQPGIVVHIAANVNNNGPSTLLGVNTNVSTEERTPNGYCSSDDDTQCSIANRGIPQTACPPR